MSDRMLKKINEMAEKGVLNRDDYIHLYKLVEDGQCEGIDEAIAIIEQNHETELNEIRKKNIVSNGLLNKDLSGLIDKSDSFSSKLYKIDKKLESMHELNSKLEADNAKLLKKINAIITDNIQLTTENTELKARSQQQKIDEKIPSYVSKVSGKLDKDDLFFTNMARNWSILGIIVTFLAVAAAFYTFSQGTHLLTNNEQIKWVSILYIFIRGTLGIGLLSWLALVCFSNSRNYTHESIRRKDRQHALSFGQLFLQIYGSSATKEDAMEVFKDWNMSGESSFSKGAETPPNMLQTVKSAMQSVNKNKTTGNE